MLRAIQMVTANASLQVGYDEAFVDAVGGNLTFTLPDITDVDGLIVTVNRIDISANTATVEPFSALQTLNGGGLLGLTSTTLGVGIGMTFKSYNGQWYYF